MSIDDTDALHKLLHDHGIKANHVLSGGTQTQEDVEQILLKRGFRELAMNLKFRLYQGQFVSVSSKFLIQEA